MLAKALASLVVLAALVACGRPHASAPVRTHHLTDAEIAAIPNAFPTTIVPPHTPRFEPLAAGFTEWDTVARVGQLTSTLIDLRRVRVPMVVEECGKARAFFQSSTSEIHICYELIALANELSERAADAYDQDTHALVAFTTAHEIAHALLDLLRLEPADEEDRADQFALLLITNYDNVELARSVVRAPAGFFARLHEAEGGAPAAGDPHSASILRAANALCILWGRHHDPVLRDHLADRAAHCEAFTQEALAYWNRLLAPYTRLDTGRTFSTRLGPD